MYMFCCLVKLLVGLVAAIMCWERTWLEKCEQTNGDCVKSIQIKWMEEMEERKKARQSSTVTDWADEKLLFVEGGEEMSGILCVQLNTWYVTSHLIVVTNNKWQFFSIALHFNTPLLWLLFGVYFKYWIQFINNISTMTHIFLNIYFINELMEVGLDFFSPSFANHLKATNRFSWKKFQLFGSGLGYCTASVECRQCWQGFCFV